MIKRLLIAIVLLAIVAGGVVGFNLFRDKAITDFFAAMPVPTATVSTVEAQKREWTPSIDAIGTISAIRGVDLTVETAGIIKDLPIKANQKVAQGELLVQLDDAIQAADLAAGKTQGSLDQQSLDRARELASRGVGSNANLDSAQAAATSSIAQVQKLEAALAQKKLLAPFDGTLGIPRVDTGQYLTPGTVVVTLQDLDTMRADFTVPEQRLPELKIGQPVEVRLDGRDDVFKGQISGIDPKIDAASRLVSVRASIDNPDNVLTPGQFARVQVKLPVEDGVLTLPQTAIVTSLYGDYVYAVRPMEKKEQQAEQEQKTGDQAEAAAQSGQPATEPATQEARQVFVQVGRRNGIDAEIVKGLNPGDIVITAGQNRLNNGTPVKIDNTIDPSKAGGPAAQINDDTQDGSVDASGTGGGQ